ncbi:MAG: hypothetical protein KKA62_06195 [Nanoarchaeota archaeon]|nr:hypothetical protein [Nanoarchaeota archaeon]MBU1644180.1 hypothetical protein [Nanoarchaeota archaeon]MBU1977515.1 hypothetical protein [Nanoarchaeota archaeon]
MDSELVELIKKTEISFITDYVDYIRKKENIVPTFGTKFELSCLAFGEGYNLLHRQLVLTINGSGDWVELNYPIIRDLVISEIHKDKSYFKERPQK